MSRRTERIEGQINEISERMASRLDVLSRELDAKAIAARLMGKPDPGIGDMADFAIEKARENPMAVAMVGIGLISLFGGGMFGRPAGRRTVVEVDEFRAGAPEAGALDETARERGKASEWTHQARHATSEAAAEMRDAVAGVAEGARRRAEETIRESSRRARTGAETARKTMRRQSMAATDWVRANPVACGLMVMAAGAAVASLMTARTPPSRDAASELFKARAREREAEELRAARRSGHSQETFEELSRQAGGRGPDGLATTQGFGERPAPRPASPARPATAAGTGTGGAGTRTAPRSAAVRPKQPAPSSPKESVKERVASDNAAATAHVHQADGKTTSH